MRAKIGKLTVEIPEGYRRVSNGYTRLGDKFWYSTSGRDGSWLDAHELENVMAFKCVIRPKEKS